VIKGELFHTEHYNIRLPEKQQEEEEEEEYNNLNGTVTQHMLLQRRLGGNYISRFRDRPRVCYLS